MDRWVVIARRESRGERDAWVPVDDAPMTIPEARAAVAAGRLIMANRRGEDGVLRLVVRESTQGVAEDHGVYSPHFRSLGFSEREDDIIRRLYPTGGSKAVQSLLRRRAIEDIRYRASRLGVRREAGVVASAG